MIRDISFSAKVGRQFGSRGILMGWLRVSVTFTEVCFPNITWTFTESLKTSLGLGSFFSLHLQAMLIHQENHSLHSLNL